MTSNLANVYANLLRKYGESLTVTYAKPPSYLSKILGPEQASKILLIYEEDRRRAKTTNFISPSKLNLKKTAAANTSKLDLTGSPLKDDCVVEAIEDISLDQLQLFVQNPWKLEEECHKGISLEKARSIISMQDFQIESTATPNDGDESNALVSQGSVWVLCCATDQERTLLLQFEFVKGYFSRGLITYMGVVPTYEVNTQSLLRRHYALIRPGSGLDTSIENSYHIRPHMVLRCSVSTTASLPSLIDLSASCDVTLAQTFRFSECGPLTQDLMNQLRILMYIRNDIVAFKEADGSKEAVYRCGRGIDMDELRDSINKVMTEVSGFGHIVTNTDTESDIEAVLLRAKIRGLADITDQLWDVLKCCSSYKDLKMAFNILFQCAARCTIVNTPTNKNRLAEIITEVAKRRLAIPCLTGSEPLELLLEIGLEKLLKDYEYIFTESKFCSTNTLKYKCSTVADDENAIPSVSSVRKSLRNAVLTEHNSNNTNIARKTFLHNNLKEENRFQHEEVIGFKNSNFNEQETAARLARLLQIHCTLEHLLMIHINLNISNAYRDVCEQLLSKPPRFVNIIDESLTDDIEISLFADNVCDHLKGKDPHTRRITMTSKNAFREVTSTFYYSIENIFPPGISECYQTEDKEITKENFYYGWLHRKIKSLK